MPKGNICNVCGAKISGTVMVGSLVSSTSDSRKHKSCANAVVAYGDIGKPQKAAVRAAKAKKASARKELTGRVRQGNHDSKTKPGVRGGPKGDKHDNGTRQNGHAGQ